MHDKPDFSKYSLRDLEDVLENIDREKYEDRYLEVLSILEDEDSVRNLKEDQRKKKSEMIAGLSALGLALPIINGILILIFGISLTKYSGLLEVESLATRVVLGILSVASGIFVWLIFYRKKL